MRLFKKFTITEIFFVIAVLIITGFIIFKQQQTLETVTRDNAKKTAINAIYYNLEEVFYPTNGYYPLAISSENLPAINSSSFIDPNGKKINTAGSDYSYTPLNCTNSRCKSYTLKATLTNEADYLKTNKIN